MDRKLLDYCSTDNQKKLMECYIEAGNNARAVAKQLNLSHGNVARTIRNIKSRAARAGYAPEYGLENPLPPIYRAKKVAVYNRATESTPAHWLSGVADEQAIEEINNSIAEGVLEGIRGKSKAYKTPTRTDSNLLNAIIIGDAHIGLLAHGIETLDGDFDLKICQAQIKAAVDYLMRYAPPAEEGLLVNVGDWFHANDPSFNTPRGGNKLDVDGRHHKTFYIGGLLQRYIIDSMLKRHKHVTVINAKGNHDFDIAKYMGTALGFYYENNDRVTVQPTIGDFNYFRFGKNIIQVNHHENCKPEKLAALMFKHQREAMAECIWRYCWGGHVHHKRVFDITELDVTFESFRNLAPSDAWHASHGYQSPKMMTRKTLHRDFGEIDQGYVNHLMLEAEEVD